MQMTPEQQQLAMAQLDRTYNPQRFDKSLDQIETYGSIIKDLIEPDKIIEQFRLDVLGRAIINGEEVQIREQKIDESSAYEFIHLIKSIVNQNTHFSKYDEKTIKNMIYAANYHINRFLMFQGNKIPIRYRANLATQAMCLIVASLYKASEGNILVWSKGQIQETTNYNDAGNKKRSLLDTVLPWRR